MDIYSQRFQDVIRLSREEALRTGCDYIGTEHLALALIRDGNCGAIKLLKRHNVDIDRFKAVLEQNITPVGTTVVNGNIALTEQATTIIKMSGQMASANKAATVETEHLLLSLLKHKANTAASLLDKFGVTYESITGNTVAPIEPPAAETPVLDMFSSDLTKLAKSDKIDPVVGRFNEIEQVAEILSCRKKNNPVLIGDPGVGKTAIVEGLALRIVNKTAPAALDNHRIVALDMGMLVAGTKFRGQFEERIQEIINELKTAKNVVLFIDEVHTLIGAGNSGGNLDAANMIKPALARGDLRCIGATTLDEYRKYVEKDGALERRFQKVVIEPLSTDETLTVLNTLKPRYEQHHKVTYEDVALKSIVTLSNKYMVDHNFPDKAIDLLDIAGSRVRLKNFTYPKEVIDLSRQIEQVREDKLTAVAKQQYDEANRLKTEEEELIKQRMAIKEDWENARKNTPAVVTVDIVEDVVAKSTGIPVTRIAESEADKLLKLPERLHRYIVGQDEAIQKVARAVKRSRVGIKDPKKPTSFIFLGPTGVGKTELAKVLNKELFGTDENIIRIDMSEYMEKFNVSKLIGAPPGYVGYDDGGQLTEKVRRKPYSVVLLDEIEKAHPDVFNLLLQIMDDGILTDSYGRKVNFKNVILIMTSNIGTREAAKLSKGIFGFGNEQVSEEKDKQSDTTIKSALKDTFNPEFINRIDDIVIFSKLTLDQIKDIIVNKIIELSNRLQDKNISLSITDEAKNFLAEKSFSPEYGARPVRRTIAQYIEDPLTDLFLEGTLQENQVEISLDEAEQKLKFTSKNLV